MNGQRFRTFNMLDDYSREILAIGVDANFPSARVIRKRKCIAAWLGYSEKLRMDKQSGIHFRPTCRLAEQQGAELLLCKESRRKAPT